MAQYPKPLPAVTPLNAPFWEGLKRRELRLQRCDGCSRMWYPPGPLCPYCWSDKFTWRRLCGRGRVNSWVVFHQAYFKSFEAELPYNVAEVELEEGPRLLTNLVGVRNEEIRAGMAVEVVFEDATEEITLAKFKPAAADRN
ncbi:MAG TPA: OB-fold domain-containing protein [Candidatus Binataceae bacterium]|nr:OB-fold domain-containing protein [Candidatus Binataceae bacterium]